MDQVEEFLQLLDLNKDEIAIYLFLIKHGQSTVLQISRGTNISRINIYRKSENLEKLGLVRRIVQHKTTLFEATSISHLKRLVKQKQTLLKLIDTRFPHIENLLQDLKTGARNKFAVRYYSGQKELQQLLWNSLSSKTDLKGFGYRSLKEVVGNKFIIEWWAEMVRRQIVNKIIANPETFKLKETLANHLVSQAEEAKIWKPRVLQPDVLEIKTESFIYNDIYAIIQWENDQAYGIEIENSVIARQEEGVFDILWEMATPWEG